jgi:Protein of unknown function (DUF3631)
MEVWRPLLAIAELDGESWAARARRAALALAAGDDDDRSLGLVLLADCRTVFDQQQVERIATQDLISHLGALDESPWAEWWLDAMGEPLKSAPRKLAQRLRPYGIRSTNVRTDEKIVKGYRREDFLDAWERFLSVPRPSATSATSATSRSDSQADVADVADVEDRRDGDASRFCPECTTPEACAREHDCRELARRAAEYAGTRLFES